MKCRTRQAFQVIEEVVGIEGVVAQKLEGAAVEVVRARFLNRVDDVAHAPAILRRIGVGLNLELLQFIDGGHVNDAIPIAGAIPVTVEEEDRRAHATSSEIKEGDILVYVALRARRI